MNNEIENPENNEEEVTDTTEQTPKNSIIDSINFVVDMMNSGKPNPKDVYPPGRYHGD
jgi:hypothetical protein